MAQPQVAECCVKAFEWDGTPSGTETTLEGTSNKTYVTGSNPSVSVFIIHDLFGWKFPNLRLLADHYAREIDATVYLPDFFGGEVLPFDLILAGRWAELDLPSFIGRNSRAVREPEIFAFASALRAKHDKVGAVGFCYGGWATHRLGAKEHIDAATGRSRLVDCITTGHPSLLTKQDIDEVAVPSQILAPEIDTQFTQELKSYWFETIGRKGLPFDFQAFPGVEHGCLVRGDPNVKGERAAMARGKSAAVAWIKYWLHDG